MSGGESRSPTYPQMGLSRCIDMLRRLYEGIHRGAVGNVEAQQIIGFSGRSGTGLAALSAMKRFGLVGGRDPTIRITDLGLRILEPIDERERREALREAGFNPPLFGELIAEFGGKLPADPVIRAKLIREKGFTPAGVDGFIRSLKETYSFVQQAGSDGPISAEEIVASAEGRAAAEGRAIGEGAIATPPNPAPIGTVGVPSAHATPDSRGSTETIKVRISPETTVTVSFDGPVTRDSMLKLARFVEFLSDSYEPSDA